MNAQSRTIGSGSDCDVVVDNTTVSSHHCRLTKTGDHLTIEDLNSTNGTHVNGERIYAPRSVSMTDRITLGQSQPMPWPDALKPAEPQAAPAGTSAAAASDAVITIGRDPQNSVVLNESNVSSFHARLTIAGDSLRLDDLGSTNGTSVGTVENKINSATIGPNDTVFFGSKSFSVAELIARADGTPDAAATPTTESGTPSKAVAAVAAVTVVAVTGLLTIWSLLPGSHQESAPLATDAGLQTSGSNAFPQSAPAGGASDDQRPALSPQERLRHSLFFVVASDPKRTTQFRLGTAFAIDAQHVATSASIISAMRDLQANGYPEIFLYSPENEAQLEIVEAVVHPEYQRAHSDAQQEYETILDKYDLEPPPPAQLESVKARLLSAQEKAFLAIERKTTFDVAVIQTGRPLEHWLDAAEPEFSLRPNLKLKVCGLAFDVEDPYFEPQSPAAPEPMEGRIRQVTRISPDLPPRLLAEGQPRQLEVAYFGSPAMTPQGQVVGIYSRPTPPIGSQESTKPPETFDAPLFDRVRECLDLQP